MNKRPFSGPLILLVSGILLLSSSLQAKISSPTRLPIRKEGKFVTFELAPGPMQLVLEGRSGGGWKPLAVQYVNRKQKEIPRYLSFLKSLRNASMKGAFDIPRGYDRPRLRVMARPMRFPANFLSGPRQFSGVTSRYSNSYPVYAVSAPYLRGGVDNLEATSGVGAAPVVEESDIWKVVGDQLFFFNEYRGLQVFDLSDSRGPIRTGTLRLAARGEQFFTLNPDGSRLALLARDPDPVDDNGDFFVGWGRDEAHSVHLLSVEGGVPSLLGSLPMLGSVADSRLIGERLYVLCSRYWDDAGQYSPLSVLHSFDLSDPSNPFPLAPVTLDGDYNPVLQGFPGTLLVATSGNQNFFFGNRPAQSPPPTGPMVHVLDISGPDGQPVFVKSLPTTGDVHDKFKLHLDEGIITAVSATTNWSEGAAGRKTWVETFAAAGPETAPLGRIEILGARGESLHATRFDGDRLYVVTFRNIDPLFVIDLSNPSAPAVTGYLEIPGWSTYIAPYGNRLVSVGVEESRVAVSLFDVSDDAAPALLSRVFLGKGHSWSEANYDEKAVGFFPEDGLMLVPYQTSDAGSWTNAVAVIEVSPQGLTQHGSIAHDFVARRAAISGDRIVSISGKEMILLDAADLADPQLLAQLSLSWKVDRVVPFGPDHLIQIEEGSQGFGGIYTFARVANPASAGVRPMIRVTRSDDPDVLVEEIEMGDGRLVGAVRKGDHLLVGQVVSGSSNFPETLRTWVFDISTPPVIREFAYSDSHLPRKAVDSLDFDNVQALWPAPDTLVWHLPVSAWPRWYSYRSGPIALDSVQTVSPAKRSTAAQKRNSANLADFGMNRGVSSVISEPDDRSPNQSTVAVLLPVRFNANSEPFAIRPVVVAGASSYARPTPGSTYASNGFVFTTYEAETKATGGNENRPMWQNRSWMKVIDLRSPYSPVVRNRVSIPGRLLGVADVDGSGAILFTDNHSNGRSRPGVTACAYDGVNAYRLSSWSETGGSALAATTSDGEGRLFVATDGKNPAVTSLRFDAKTSSFENSGSLPLSGTRNELQVINGFLLASSWGRLDAAKIDDDGAFESPATFDTPVNLWIQVSRAAVEPSAGIWLPVLDYGVEFLGFEELATVANSQPD